jgi:hypothetical protein
MISRILPGFGVYRGFLLMRRRAVVYLVTTVLATAFATGQGAVSHAATAPVSVAPTRVSASLLWPHSTDQQTSKKINYANKSGKTVTLKLSVAATLDSKQVAAQPFRLSAATLKVPPHKTRSITLTTRGYGVPVGTYAGTLTAKATKPAVTLKTTLSAYVEPERYDLTINAVDRTGTQVRPGLQVTAIDRDQPTGLPDGLLKTGVKYRVAPGPYDVYATIGGPGRTTTLADAQVTVARNTVYTLDARPGRRLTIDNDEVSAAPVTTQVKIDVPTHGPAIYTGHEATVSGDPDQIYVLPTQRPGVILRIGSLWQKRGSTSASPSPYSYAYAATHNGIPADLAHHIHTADLAKVTTSYRSDNGHPAPSGQSPVISVQAAGIAMGYHTAFIPGSKVVWYLTPGVQYRQTVGYPASHYYSGWRTYRAGDSTETWNDAAIGPRLNDPSWVLKPSSWADRRGDHLRYSADLFTDSDPDHYAWINATYATTLAGDGTQPATSPRQYISADLPAAPGWYTLTTTGARNSPTILSSTVQMTWRFYSGHTDSRQNLPLAVIRYTPQGLNDHNSAHAGTTTQIPLQIERPTGITTPITALTVETSTDDGSTWQPTTLTPTAGGWTAQVTNPANPGFVSLRATVTDSDGNNAVETITRAYQVSA